MEQKNNNGVLFRNNNKQNANQPDYTGNAVVNGKEMVIAAWVKQSQKGTNYLSIAFSEPRQQNAAPQNVVTNGQPAPQTPSPANDPASDLPF